MGYHRQCRPGNLCAAEAIATVPTGQVPKGVHPYTLNQSGLETVSQYVSVTPGASYHSMSSRARSTKMPDCRLLEATAEALCEIPLYDQEGPSDDGGLCDFGATRVCAEHTLCKPIVLQ